MDPPSQHESARPGCTTGRGVALIYVALWVPFALIGGVLLIEDVPMIVLIFTLGLGVLTFPIPTGLAYYTALAPAVALLVLGVRRTLAAAMALLGVAAVAILPGARSQQAWWEAAADWRSDDLDAPLPQRPDTLRLVRSDRRTHDPADALDLLPCTAICQRLLYDAGLDAVEVAAWDPRNGAILSVTWRRQTRATCPPTFTRARDALPATRRSLARGDCLLHEVDAPLAAAPWLRTERLTYSTRRREARSRGIRDVDTVHRAEAGAAETPFDAPVWRRMGVEDSVLAIPFLFVPRGGGDLKMSLRPWRQEVHKGRAEPTDALREAFGIDLPPLPEAVPVRPEDLDALLDQPGDATFDEAQQAMIHDGLSGFLGTPIDDAGARRIGRILRDPRVTKAYLAADIAQREVASHPHLIGDLLDRVRLPLTEGGEHAHGRAGRALLDQPADHLEAWSDVIRSSVPNRIFIWNAPLLVLAAGQGHLHEQGIVDALGNEHVGVQTMAVLALCTSEDPRVADHLDRLVALGHASDSASLRADVIRTLRRHGRLEDAKRLLTTRDDRLQRQVQRDLERRPGPDPDGICRP